MIITDLSECEKLWKKHSPAKSIWEDWDVAVSFLGPKYKPHFIHTQNGLIPLVLESDKKYGIFGGEYPEDVRFWIDINSFDEFVKIIPDRTVIFDMNFEQVSQIKHKFPQHAELFAEEDKQYLLNLEKLDYSIQNYLKTFSHKHRKNLVYDLKKVQELNIEKCWGGIEYFDDLVKFNIKRFGDESDFLDAEFVSRLKNFFVLMDKRNSAYFLAIKVNGVIQGVEAAVIYNNTYYLINGCANLEIKNLGKLLIFEHIKKAMELKCHTMDFLVGDTGWKELWNLEYKTCITFRKGIKANPE
jgi:hypothetical protein